MLTNLLFINLFLHIIVFSWMKVEQNAYIYRLAIISLALALASSVYDTFIFYDGFAITLLNDCLRINQAVLAQESLLILNKRINAWNQFRRPVLRLFWFAPFLLDALLSTLVASFF